MPASADSGPRWSDAELARLSDVIVVGRVVAVASARDLATGGLYTYVTMDLEDVVKGWVPTRQIVLKQLGGRADGLAYVVPGQATFAVGEEALAFLEVRPRDRTLYTAALWQGKWSVTRDSAGRRVARRTDPAAAARYLVAAHEERLLPDFVIRLRRLVGEAARRPGGGADVTVRPLETPSDTGTLGPVSDRFTLLGPMRWFEADVNRAIPVDLQTGGQPGLGGGGGGAEIETALGLWNSAGSSLRLSAGSFRGPRCSDRFEGDGRISITVMDPCGEMSNSGGTLAIGGGWLSEGDTRVVNGQIFHRLLQGTIVLNDSALALQFLTKSRCFQDIQTHELGHAFGLGHSDQPTAIMFPTIDNACSTAVSQPGSADITGGLGPDDLAGIRFIYPPTSFTPPSMPSNLQSSVEGSTVRLTWNAPTAGGPVSTYVVEAGSTTGTSNLANFATGSTATSYVATGVPPATYFVRVRARNDGGTSSASNEIMLTVQPAPCLVPGSPGALGFTVSGSLVRLMWNAPSSGGAATAYLVEAGSRSGAADLAVLDTGTTATMFMAMAPPGTYFVRVRAKNACGTGGASNEVTILVP